jgi:hypothetical protein
MSLAQLRDLLPEPPEWWCAGFGFAIIAAFALGSLYNHMLLKGKSPTPRGFDVVRPDDGSHDQPDS